MDRKNGTFCGGGSRDVRHGKTHVKKLLLVLGVRGRENIAEDETDRCHGGPGEGQHLIQLGEDMRKKFEIRVKNINPGWNMS